MGCCWYIKITFFLEWSLADNNVVMLLQEFNARLGHGYFMAIKNQRDAIRRHVDDPCTAKHRTWVVTGIKKDGTAAMRWYKLTFVNESGFYALVLGSKLPTAVKFKNWVTSDVLPQIRKTGGYIPVQQGESNEETIRHAEEILRATLKEKENLLKKQCLQIE